LAGVEPVAAGLDADHAHGGVVEERMEQADGVRAAADRRDQASGRRPSASASAARASLADDDWKSRTIPDRDAARRRADDVERVSHIRHPVAQRLVHRVLQRARAGGHGHDLGAQQLHAEHVGRLALHVVAPM
jgi:hypothetical protein